MKYLALITLILFIGCNAHRTPVSDDNIKDDVYHKSVITNPKMMLDKNYVATYHLIYSPKKITLGKSIIQLNKNDTLIIYVKLGQL